MYTLIMQRELFWYLTKKSYENFREEMKDYSDYMTSLGWDNLDEAISFIKQEWGLSEKEIQVFKEFDKNDSIQRIVLKIDGWQFENNEPSSEATKFQ